MKCLTEPRRKTDAKILIFCNIQKECIAFLLFCTNFVTYSYLIIMGFFSSLFGKEKKEALDKGLEKTKTSVFSKISRAIAGKSKVDEEVLDNLEEVLVTSDVGVDTTLRIIERIEARVARDKYVSTDELNEILRDEIASLLEENNTDLKGDFDVPEGKHPYVIMVVGVNGAGKTTLMRMICGILKPTSGTISLDGMDVSEEGYRAVLGYLPQDFGYYPEFTGMDFLLYMSALKGIEKSQAKRKTKELLQLVSLQDVAKKKIKTYSGGMKQRLGIAQALLNQPRLLVLDEPTAGLDPKERVRFRKMIADLGTESIVLLSTHIVSDIEQIADEVLIMKDGQIIYQDKWDDNKGTLEDFYLQHIDEEAEHE